MLFHVEENTHTHTQTASQVWPFEQGTSSTAVGPAFHRMDVHYGIPNESCPFGEQHAQAASVALGLQRAQSLLRGVPGLGAGAGAGRAQSN